MPTTTQAPNPALYRDSLELDWERDLGNRESKPVFSKGELRGFSGPQTIIPEISNDTQVTPTEARNTTILPAVDLGLIDVTKKAAETVLDTAADLGQETLVDAVDLAKQFIGWGEKKAPQPQNPEEEAKPLDTPTRADILKSTVPLEVYQQLADAALMKDMNRIVGRGVTDQEARDKGHLDKNSIAAMIGIAKSDSEVVDKIEDRQQAKDTAAVTPGNKVGENELINNEKSGPYGGSGDTPLG